MFETHRVRSGRSEIYATWANTVEADHDGGTPEISAHPPENSAERKADSDRDGAGNAHGTYNEATLGEESECADVHGNAFLVRPKRPAKSRNRPGQLAAAMRSSISNFRETPKWGERE